MSLFKKNPKTELERRIGYVFRSRELFRQALTHRSWLIEDETSMREDSNERLEFLGDAVLELAVADHLFHEFPGRDEGQLTEYRRILVGGKLLAMKAKELGLDQTIFLSPQEEESGGRSKRSILSDAYEALLGAIYIDGGMKPATAFIEKFHLSDRDEQLTSISHVNFKGRLLELLQSRGSRPTYRVIDVSGPDHNKRFDIAVYIGENEIGRGLGESKKSAEQNAARAALESI